MKTLLLLSLSAASILGAHATLLFDGQTFEGWEGPLTYFRIEDGAIVGGTLDSRIPKNQFLTTKRNYKDFELRLKFRVVGGVNAGVQIRTKRIPHHHEVIGYQADIGVARDFLFWGVLYDESRRRTMLAGGDIEKKPPLVNPDGWNEYVIRAQGNRIQLWMNGIQTVDYLEEDPTVWRSGVIGLQIHSGPPSEIWYKDIFIEEL